MWAAQQAQQGLGQIQDVFGDAEGRAGGYLTQGYGVGREALGAGYADALDYLGQGYAGAAYAAQQPQGMAEANRQTSLAETRGLAALNYGRDQSRNLLLGPGGATDITRSQYGQARDAFSNYMGQGINTLGGAAAAYDPLISHGMAGYGMLNNALGLGGAGGNAAARNAFQAGPGYQWQVDQATDAAQRAGNRIGSAYGGNVIDATTRLGSNLANQEWSKWIGNLQPYQQAALAATAGKTGVLGQQASMQGAQGQGLAGLYTGESGALTDITKTAASNEMASAGAASNLMRATGQSMSDRQAQLAAYMADLNTKQGGDYASTATNYAQQLANLGTGYGSSMAGLIGGTAGNIASAMSEANKATIEAGTAAMTAGQNASSNQWGAILGGLGLGSKLLGGAAGGGGGLLTSLFK